MYTFEKTYGVHQTQGPIYTNTRFLPPKGQFNSSSLLSGQRLLISDERFHAMPQILGYFVSHLLIAVLVRILQMPFQCVSSAEQSIAAVVAKVGRRPVRELVFFQLGPFHGYMIALRVGAFQRRILRTRKVGFVSRPLFDECHSYVNR